ncbi:hypothetical protein Holit_00471 [Hollandina sp. SP2]
MEVPIFFRQDKPIENLQDLEASRLFIAVYHRPKAVKGRVPLDLPWAPISLVKIRVDKRCQPFFARMSPITSKPGNYLEYSR